MRILFCGDAVGNSGPGNVNKEIVKNLNSRFLYANWKNKYLHMLQLCFLLLRSRVVVVSGVSRKGALLFRLAGLLGKRKVYLMHGCAAWEIHINQITLSEKILAQERYLLEHSDLILAVSHRYALWFRQQYPQYAHKVSHLTLGVSLDVPDFSDVPKVKGHVAAVGGMRKLKNNSIVADVVESMNGRASLVVYGMPAVATGHRHTLCKGHIPHDQFLKGLAEAELFVLNSLLESFSLAAIEALLCGCSVLISQVAGVTDLLTLEESDIIRDPNDKEELTRKIAYLLEHPNNQRILSRLDLQAHTYEKCVQRLENLCIDLIRQGK